MDAVAIASAILKVGVAGCFLLAALDGYQAITGRRVLSKLQSRRTDRQVRVQSAIAAIVLSAIALSAIWLLARL
jgi:hypothetical protein